MMNPSLSTTFTWIPSPDPFSTIPKCSPLAPRVRLPRCKQTVGRLKHGDLRHRTRIPAASVAARLGYKRVFHPLLPSGPHTNSTLTIQRRGSRGRSPPTKIAYDHTYFIRCVLPIRCAHPRKDTHSFSPGALGGGLAYNVPVTPDPTRNRNSGPHCHS